jgi:hypothetical protein
MAYQIEPYQQQEVITPIPTVVTVAGETYVLASHNGQACRTFPSRPPSSTHCNITYLALRSLTSMGLSTSAPLMAGGRSGRRPQAQPGLNTRTPRGMACLSERRLWVCLWWS